ncbi:MAG TPA: hypothetical protein VHO69_08315 [Phototrophicaceae bacterium]|nr:hypothetical protein [Phototrophicaceae bacterium]
MRIKRLSSTGNQKWRFVLAVLLLAALTGCTPGDVVTAGPGTLELKFQLPAGYHLNALTTSQVIWEVDGVVVQTTAQPEMPVTTLEDPLRLPVTFAVGEAVTIAHLNIRYCTDDQTRCIVAKQDLQLPVHVAAAGRRSTLAAAYTIVPP